MTNKATINILLIVNYYHNLRNNFLLCPHEIKSDVRLKVYSVYSNSCDCKIIYIFLLFAIAKHFVLIVFMLYVFCWSLTHSITIILLLQTYWALITEQHRFALYRFSIGIFPFPFFSISSFLIITVSYFDNAIIYKFWQISNGRYSIERIYWCRHHIGYTLREFMISCNRIMSCVHDQF